MGKMVAVLRGAAAAVVLLGSGLVATANFLPVRPAVPEPPDWLGAIWVVLPGLLLVTAGLAISAARALEPRTTGFRFCCGVLTLAMAWPAWWSLGYAAAALGGGLPVLAPVLFAIGFVGVVLGAAVLTVTGPVVRPESSWSQPAPPLQSRRPLAGAAGGAVVMGATVAVFAGWIAVGPVDATTAQPVDRPAVPADSDNVSWTWQPPAGQYVLDVVAAGGGVVVRFRDGVVALDGRTGKERWHYRRPGAKTLDLAASPSGQWVMVDFVSTVEDAEGTRVLALDAMTGEVGLDSVTEGGVFGGVRLDLLTDHVLVGGHDKPLKVVQGYDLRTGTRRWEYRKPKHCRWSNHSDDPVTTRDTVLLGLACGPERSRQRDVDITVTLLALDDRTGKEKWRFERTVHTRSTTNVEGDDGRWWQPNWDLDQFVAAGADGDVVRFGWSDAGTKEKAAYVLDVATGKVLANKPVQSTGEFVDFSREWMLVRDKRTDKTQYRLLALDGTPLGATQLADPLDRAYATSRVLIGVDTRTDVGDAGVRGTVVVAPWTGAPVRRIPVELGRRKVGDLLDSPALQLAPGAVVAWYRGTTRIVGIA